MRWITNSQNELSLLLIKPKKWYTGSTMNTPEELEKLRAEASELRRRIATVERAWQQQTDRAEQAIERAKQVDRENEQLKEKTKQLEEKTHQLEEHVKTLEARLAGVILHKDKLAGIIFKTNNAKKSDNSFSRRHRGGQTGHTGHGRKKPARIDEEKTVFLTHCPTCESSLKRSLQRYYERIVEDVVVPAVTKVTKYTIERQYCTHCQKEVHGTPATVLPGFRLGARALTLIIFCKYRLRLPLEKIKESLELQYGLKVKAGALTNILKQLGKKLTPEYQKIIEEIRGSPVKYADETSWRVEGTTNWCWAFLTPKAVAYTIEETRGKGVPDKMLGSNPSGVLVRDDYGSYAHLSLEQQSCWAHLLRNSRDFLKQETVSKDMKDLYTELINLYSVLNAIIARPFEQGERRQYHTLLHKQITHIIERRYHATDTKSIQTRIRNQNTNLLTALLHQDVPLTNNAAERQMRPIAVMRKISGGSRSAAGAKATAVNMSILQTITLKKQSFFARLAELLTPMNQKYSVEVVGKN